MLTNSQIQNRCIFKKSFYLNKAGDVLLLVLISKVCVSLYYYSIMILICLLMMNAPSQLDLINEKLEYVIKMQETYEKTFSQLKK